MQIEKKFKQAASFINTFNKFIDKDDKVNINENELNNLNEFIKSFKESYFNPEDIDNYPILGIIDDEYNSFNQYDILDNCKYRYVDSEFNYINNFDEFSYRELISFNEHNIAPYLAEKIAVIFKNSIIGFIELENFKKSFEERKYRVGLMSDVHYNDYTIDIENDTYDEDGSEYRNDILNALSFYQNKEDVDFMCVAGDLSSDSIKHILNFKQTLNNYAPTTNLYSCFGNHDFKSTSYDVDSQMGSDYNEIGLNIEDKTRLEAWNSLITPENSEYELHYQDETTEYGKTSYWFEVPIEGTNKSDIYIFLSVNYGYGNDTTIANLQLTEESPNIQPLIDYVGFMPSRYNFQFYDNSTLIWFKDVLDQFQNKRIFIFTHQFFSYKAGNNNSENYLYSYAGDYWRITDDSAYCLSGIQFEFLNKLNNEHKNTIWFTGHSHYKWCWQIEDQYINICNNEYEIYRPDDEDFDEMKRYMRKSQESIGKSGYNVHLPSTCRPLPLGIFNYEVAGKDSEGAIMDVYENYVDIRGIIFKENGSEYKNKYYSLAQYRINIPSA